VRELRIATERDAENIRAPLARVEGRA